MDVVPLRIRILSHNKTSHHFILSFVSFSLLRALFPYPTTVCIHNKNAGCTLMFSMLFSLFAVSLCFVWHIDNWTGTGHSKRHITFAMFLLFFYSKVSLISPDYCTCGFVFFTLEFFTLHTLFVLSRFRMRSLTVNAMLKTNLQAFRALPFTFHCWSGSIVQIFKCYNVHTIRHNNKAGWWMKLHLNEYK